MAADTTLQAIYNKVRRITRSLSESQLTTDQLNDYINTFVLYDFPEHLRLFNLRKTFYFVTSPYEDVYQTSTDPLSPLYDFKNAVITVHPPIYVAGKQANFFESRDQFNALYPEVASIQSIGVTGDGATVQFAGVINTQQTVVQPFVQNNPQGIVLLKSQVLFGSTATNGDGLNLVDTPISPMIGNLAPAGTPPTSFTVQDPNNYINYVSGQYVITFTAAPAQGFPINSQVVPMQPSRPDSVLFFDGQFVLRPIPDQPYRVQMEVQYSPVELLATTQHPDLNEWWQVIAWGASKKIFEDRMDMESVALILPEFNKQMMLCQRRTIVQQTSQRTSTIYDSSSGVAGAYGPGLFGGGGNL